MSWLRKLGRATHLWGSGSSALSYLSGNVDWRRQRDQANSAYQRAAADKLKAGINPLFDGAAASPIAQSNTAESADSILKAIGLPLGLVGSALQSVNSVADSMSKFATSAYTGAQTKTVEESRRYIIDNLDADYLVKEVDYNLKNQLLNQLKELNPIALEQARKAVEHLDLQNKHSKADLDRAWNEQDMEQFFNGPAGNWLRLLRGFFNSGAAK